MLIAVGLVKVGWSASSAALVSLPDSETALLVAVLLDGAMKGEDSLDEGLSLSDEESDDTGGGGQI